MLNFKKLSLFLLFWLILSLLLTNNILAQENNIYFIKDDNIWLLDLNTRQEKQLTTSGKIRAPVISSDKTKIAFMADPTQTDMGFWVGLLGVSDIDGSNEKKYPDLEVVAGQYAWSPDSTKIAVVTTPKKMFVVDVTANDIQPVVISAENLWHPSWSPDGNKIAVRAYKEGVGDVIIYDVNPKLADLVFESPFKFGSEYFVPAVSWSADGQKIVFETQKEYKQGEMYHNNLIWLVDLNTRSKQQIAEGFSPLFSPRGDMVVFAAAKEDINGDGKVDLQDIEIYMYDVNSGTIKKVTNNDTLDRIVAWSRDGDKILYNEITYESETDEKGKHELFIIDIDSGDSEKLLAEAYGLAWQQEITTAQVTPTATFTATPTPGKTPKPAVSKVFIVLAAIAIFVIIIIIVLAILVGIKTSKSPPSKKS